MKSIDKMAWQTTVRYYRTWNDAKERQIVRDAGKKSPTQKWHEFLALMEFGLKIKPYPSEREQRRKVDMLNRYYEKIQQFEQRRKQREESAS